MDDGENFKKVKNPVVFVNHVDGYVGKNISKVVILLLKLFYLKQKLTDVRIRRQNTALLSGSLSEPPFKQIHLDQRREN